AALPLGLFGFEVHGVTPGGTASVRLTLPAGVSAAAYLKEDPATGSLERFDFDGTTGAVIDGSVVTLYLIDGGRGDADGRADGVIVDPGGIGPPPGPTPVPTTEPPGPGTLTPTCTPGLEGWEVIESGGT